MAASKVSLFNRVVCLIGFLIHASANQAVSASASESYESVVNDEGDLLMRSECAAAYAGNALSTFATTIREFLLVLLIFHLCASQALCVSEITPDGTLGTAITQGGATYNITGGTRNGSNLFHSFGLFNVGSGDTANFLNNTGLATTNILGRVTSG